MSDADSQRIERLITMAERLIDALSSDIAALKSGNARALRTLDPEIQRLSVLYSREATGLNKAAAESAPSDLRKRLVDATARFRDVLAMQTRLLTRLRGASEGMVRAVAEEIERRNTSLRPYGPGAATASASRQPLIVNSVV